MAEPKEFLGSLETYLRELIDAECRWMGADEGPVSGAPAALVVRASAALELLHSFAVVHDDVMDGSSTRRRRPHGPPREQGVLQP